MGPTHFVPKIAVVTEPLVRGHYSATLRMKMGTDYSSLLLLIPFRTHILNTIFVTQKFGNLQTIICNKIRLIGYIKNERHGKILRMTSSNFTNGQNYD